MKGVSSAMTSAMTSVLKGRGFTGGLIFGGRTARSGPTVGPLRPIERRCFNMSRGTPWGTLWGTQCGWSAVELRTQQPPYCLLLPRVELGAAAARAALLWTPNCANIHNAASRVVDTRAFSTGGRNDNQASSPEPSSSATGSHDTSDAPDATGNDGYRADASTTTTTTTTTTAADDDGVRTKLHSQTRWGSVIARLPPRWQEAWRRYGSVFVGTYFVVYFSSIGILFVLFDSGLLVPSDLPTHSIEVDGHDADSGSSPKDGSANRPHGPAHHVREDVAFVAEYLE